MEEGGLNETANSKELVTGISQTKPGNVTSTGELVTGMLNCFVIRCTKSLIFILSIIKNHPRLHHYISMIAS